MFTDNISVLRRMYKEYISEVLCIPECVVTPPHVKRIVCPGCNTITRKEGFSLLRRGCVVYLSVEQLEVAALLTEGQRVQVELLILRDGQRLHHKEMIKTCERLET